MYSGSTIGLGQSSYTLVMNDANVRAGEKLAVYASSLGSDETLTFDGSAEASGLFSVLGGAGGDSITGGAGKDYLAGNAGNDILSGGAGKDTLTGGAGADVLTGGAGARDTFLYGIASESSSGGGIDTILDFEVNLDKINLRLIDADGDTSNGVTDFTYVGSNAFSGHAGELRWIASVDGALRVQADLDGDKVADLLIDVITLNQLPLSRSDFEI